MLTYDNCYVIIQMWKYYVIKQFIFQGGLFMWNKSRSIFLSSLLVKTMFVLLIISAFLIPTVVKWYSKTNSEENMFMPLLITLFFSLIPAFILIVSLNNLIKNIYDEKIFEVVNVTYLRIISWCCFFVTIIYGVFGFFKPLAFIICFASAFFGLIIRVIKNVFDKAIEIREENDYTI